MAPEDDRTYYERRAETELVNASRASDRSVKVIHLDLASRYATLSELAADNKSITIPGMGVSIGR